MNDSSLSTSNGIRRRNKVEEMHQDFVVEQYDDAVAEEPTSDVHHAEPEPEAVVDEYWGIDEINTLNGTHPSTISPSH